MKSQIAPEHFYKDQSVADKYILRRFHGAGGDFVNSTELSLMLQNLPTDINDRTLMDLGAGTGRLTLRLLELNPKLVIAVDPASEMLSSLSKINNKLLKIMIGKAEQLSLRSKKCDIVVSLRLFEHLNEKTIIDSLREINRVLKPKGLLVVSTVNKLSLEALCIKLLGYSSSAVFPISNFRMRSLINRAEYSYYKENAGAFIIPRGIFLHSPTFIFKMLLFIEKVLMSTPLRIFASHNVWYLRKN